MPVPRTIVIDTNIFDQHGYNFAAPAIEKFLAITEVKTLTLLLPDAIQREVRRHIRSKAAAAQTALKKARSEAPFLSKWAFWPSPDKVKTAKNDIISAYTAEWSGFVKHFQVKQLGYEGINLTEIMDWHDEQQSPFGPGQKEKEFPDAFVLASVLAHAKSKSVRVAVVSKDNDFAAFCQQHNELHYFADISDLTEAFINEMKSHVAAIKKALNSTPAQFVALMEQSFPELTFYPEEDLDGDVEDVTVDSAEIDEVRVIALEDEHCTIAFEATIEFSAYVSYDDPDTMIIDTAEDIRMPLYIRAGTVTDTATVSGTVTLEFDPAWNTVLLVSDLDIEHKNIFIRKRPPILHDHEEP